jgi:hypothetical protein
MADHDALTEQHELIQRFAAMLEKQGSQVAVFETHISWVVVTEHEAYKFKKAVKLDFLDFSTLQARRFFCEEEVRLNRRLAPDLYLGVASITGSAQRPCIDGDGAAIEYAVRMRAFAQQALWSERIKAQIFSAEEIDALAGKISQFHLAAAVAARESPWGSPAIVQQTADENMAMIASLASSTEQKQIVHELTAWQSKQHRQLHSVFENRKENGWIRECHGDLHSRNILTLDGNVEAFDCIEFNDSLRWIDVINDIAFTCMDLRMQGRHALASRFLNQYLELTGDYAGLAVFRYYQAQRALVRCKVTLLRARQLHIDRQDASAVEAEAARYLTFARRHVEPQAASVTIMHGFSGSGKSTVARQLVELTGAIRIRSDVERKRMHGLAPISRAGDAMLYSADATSRTYERLSQLAQLIVKAGMPVIVDAAFLKRDERIAFANMACVLQVPFFIVDVQAGEATMKERIIQRNEMNHDPSDADIDVLLRQFAWNEAFAADEIKHVMTVDTERSKGIDGIRVAAASIGQLGQVTKVV